MNKILILDFGSQVTQLIGRRLRELNVFCEIFPYDKMPALDDSVKGVILSGSPCSVRDANAPQLNLDGVKGKLPLLGICYGAQYLAHRYGGKVENSLAREYGRAMLDVIRPDSPLMDGVKVHSQVWMSHGDTTVVVIEHNLDVIKTGDYIIDMGPEGGSGGGTVVACGTPEAVAKCKKSYTGAYIKKMLKK